MGNIRPVKLVDNFPDGFIDIIPSNHLIGNITSSRNTNPFPCVLRAMHNHSWNRSIGGPVFLILRAPLLAMLRGVASLDDKTQDLPPLMTAPQINHLSQLGPQRFQKIKPLIDRFIRLIIREEQFGKVMNVLGLVSCGLCFRAGQKVVKTRENSTFGGISVVDGGAEISDDGFMLSEVAGKEGQKAFCGCFREADVDVGLSHGPDIQDHALRLRLLLWQKGILRQWQ